MSEPSAKAPRWAIWLPLALFVAFVALVMLGLYRPADKTVASTLVGKPMPAFSLPAALPDRPGLNSADMADGKPHLVNIFASWCIPCRVEAPQLGALARAGVPIEGISVRDSTEALQGFLEENGDPYKRVGADDDGKVQLSLGSSGVPETYVIDGKGVIRYQHIGEIRPDQIPLILEKLKEASQ
ncbi:DsbE family thiol:disulfide interchange protein [Novosphingobium sp. ST904]|uniref:DsbE family thiol:disulfide interchange protein n=1 Tax=Novosphingobium sp. ST904 TaxID=1684385 RepID=UPI0006C8C406|nr:DsbE family thiol:disulfide interchange protein [Novosphingobium sp. ST904]KPH60400.1 alkyl hydroperoxide reductase [Novosphingobium sp. ST904]TCM40034.1 cytochrome c biogenesis protein CcmG/thiol:disulfide interchange protein DsbE [Novosphingobium sp. ST904]